MDKSDVRLDNVIEAFLVYNEDRNHSPKTVRWYRDMLARLRQHLGDDARIGDLTPTEIRGYLRAVRERGLSKFTLHAYARTLKTFLRWLSREGYVEESLAKAIDMPKVPKYEDVTIDVLTDEEIRCLLGSFDINTDVGCRDRAMTCLMLESGLRLNEVASLDIDDVHLKERFIKVRGKGDKEAYVPLGEMTVRAMNRYATAFRVPANDRVRTFFLNIYGEPLKYETIKTIFDRLAERVDIPRLHPHLLRHTAATRMLANGADLHTVQRLLRHSDVRTTLRYLHLAGEQLQEKMKQFSPLNGVSEGRRRMVPTKLRRGAKASYGADSGGI